MERLTRVNIEFKEVLQKRHRPHGHNLQTGEIAATVENGRQKKLFRSDEQS